MNTSRRVFIRDKKGGKNLTDQSWMIYNYGMKKKNFSKEWGKRPFLPKIEPPTDLDAAKKRIHDYEINVVQRWEVYAYGFGVAFRWVKDNLKHGEFQAWVDDNVKLVKYRTARYYMVYSEKCDEAGVMIPYR